MTRFVLVSCVFLLSVASVSAQRRGGGRARSEPPQTIAQKTAEMKKFEGFLDFYWEETTEKIWVEVADWNKAFLYVTSTPSSVSGRNRAGWGRTRVLKFTREGAKVFLVQSNFAYRAESDDPLERRAVEEAYTPSIIAGFRVAATEEGKPKDGRALIDFTSFLMKDGTRSADPSRSAFYWPRTKNFPKNTEIEVTVTTNAPVGGGGAGGRGTRPGAGRGGRGRGSSGGNTVRTHHSFVELPGPNYKRRKYDRRAGGMSVSYLDYASPISEPLQKRFAARHRLEKKDPRAAVSEAVEPIVYHVDSGAPEPIRSALVEGASWWNEAFEAIGFKNAFRVEVLPADADPMDLRYNIIFWIHRPSRGWSSGSSVRDPRTGEIISGRVYLGSQRVRQDFMIGAGLMAPYEGEQEDTKAITEMVLARVRQLSAHEVGHTLGFGHNFAASTMGRASVMDYPHPVIKIRDDGSFDTSDAYDVGIGEWDKVMIAYAYTHFPPGVDEDRGLEQILARAHEKGMFFLGAVGSGSSSPHTTQWDNGPDALAEFENVMRVRELALSRFSEANIRRGFPIAGLHEVLAPVYLFHRYQTEAVSKSLGGVDYRFAARGDGQMIWKDVAPEAQRRALAALLRTLRPDVLALPDHILKILPESSGSGETFPSRARPNFDPLAVAETAAHHTLGFLLDPNRATRLVTQHARNSKSPSLNEVIDDLLSQTWRKYRGETYHDEIGRVVDTAVLQRLMSLASNTAATTQVRAIVNLKLELLEDWIASLRRQPMSEMQQAHYMFGLQQLNHYQQHPGGFQRTEPVAAPPGPPIGMGEHPLPGMVCGWGCEHK